MNQLDHLTKNWISSQHEQKEMFIKSVHLLIYNDTEKVGCRPEYFNNLSIHVVLEADTNRDNYAL